MPKLFLVVKVKSSEWMREGYRNKPDLFWNNANLISFNRPDLDSEVIEAWVFISFGLETPFLVGCCYLLRVSIVCKLVYSVVRTNLLSHKIRTICRSFLSAVLRKPALRYVPQFQSVHIGLDDSQILILGTFYPVKILFELQERGRRFKILQGSRFCES